MIHKTNQGRLISCQLLLCLGRRYVRFLTCIHGEVGDAMGAADVGQGVLSQPAKMDEYTSLSIVKSTLLFTLCEPMGVSPAAGR